MELNIRVIVVSEVEPYHGVTLIQWLLSNTDCLALGDGKVLAAGTLAAVPEQASMAMYRDVGIESIHLRLSLLYLLELSPRLMLGIQLTTSGRHHEGHLVIHLVEVPRVDILRHALLHLQPLDSRRSIDDTYQVFDTQRQRQRLQLPAIIEAGSSKRGQHLGQLYLSQPTTEECLRCDIGNQSVELDTLQTAAAFEGISPNGGHALGQL